MAKASDLTEEKKSENIDDAVQNRMKRQADAAEAGNRTEQEFEAASAYPVSETRDKTIWRTVHDCIAGTN